MTKKSSFKSILMVLAVALAVVAGLATPAFAATDESNDQCGFYWPVYPFNPCWPDEPVPVDEGTVFEKDEQDFEAGKDYTLITEIDGKYYAISVVLDEDGNPQLVLIPIDVYEQDGKPYVVVTDPSMVWTFQPSDNPCTPGAIDFYNEATDTKLSDLLKELGITPKIIKFVDGKLVIIDIWGRIFYIGIDENGNPIVTPNADDAASFDPYVECPDHPVPNFYEVTFLDEDGNVISKDKYPEGTPADKIKVPADPTKDPDEEYTYEFAGWTPDGGEHVYPADQLPPVTGDVEYCPWFNPIPKYATVTFLDADGNVISSEKYLKGTPVEDIVIPEDPTKPATEDTWYEFAGWDPKVGPVTDDVTYKPVFSEWTIAKWIRLWGEDRYGTMADIANTGYENAEVAVLATGVNFPDALVAASVSGAFNCPIILTRANVLCDEAKDEIEALGIKHVYVLGGPTVIHERVLSELDILGVTYERIAGDTRQSTSVKAMELVVNDLGYSTDTVVVASGRKIIDPKTKLEKGFADALSIGPWCYKTKTPILLTNNDGILTDEQVALCKELGITKLVIAGGPASVDDAVIDQLGVTESVRLGGEDRYETSAIIAKWEIEEQGMSMVNASVATGKKYPDALAGAAICGTNNSVVLLVDDVDDAGFELINNKAGIKIGYVLGGPASVSEDLMAHCEELTAAPVKVTE